MRTREYFSPWWPEATEEWRTFCANAWPALPVVATRLAFLRNANPSPKFGLRVAPFDYEAHLALMASLRAPRELGEE